MKKRNLEVQDKEVRAKELRQQIKELAERIELLPEVQEMAKLEKELAKCEEDTKFILLIPPHLDRYLSWAASAHRTHKSKIVRSSMEKSIENDAAYQLILRKQKSYEEVTDGNTQI